MTCFACAKACSVAALSPRCQLKDGVVRRDFMDAGRCALRLRGVDDGRKSLVVDHDRLRGVLRLSQRLSDHDRDVVAHIAHLALSEGRMRARLHGRAVLGMDHPAADQPADLVGGKIIAGEDCDARPASLWRHSCRWTLMVACACGERRK